MSFILPSAQYLMTSNATNNRGVIGGAGLSLKTAGNLPITTKGTQFTNTSGFRGVFFGLTSQSSSSSFDVSLQTKVLVTSFQFNAPNRIQISTKADNGMVCRIGSGDSIPPSNYKQFQIGGSDTPLASSQVGPVTTCIDLNALGNEGFGGTFNNTNVQAFGLVATKANIAGTSSMQLFMQRVFLFDTTKNASNIPRFVGSNSNWGDAFFALNGSDYTTKIGAWITKVGSAYFVPCPFEFGDGVNLTVFDDEGATIISPADNADGAENYRLTDQAMRVYLNLRDNSSDTVTLSGAYNWGTAAYWDFNQSDAASVVLQGAIFNGMGQFTLGSSVVGNATFNLSAGSDVVVIGANIDGSTINGDVQLNSAQDLTNVTINGDLYIDTNLNTSLSDILTFSGTSISGLIYNNNTINPLIINLVDGSTATASGASVGQITIQNSVDITIKIQDVNGTPIENVRVYLSTTVGNDVVLSGLSDVNGEISSSYNYISDNVVEGWTRKSTNSPYYKQGLISGVISNNGFSATITMVSDE